MSKRHRWGDETAPGYWVCMDCGRTKWVGTVVGKAPRFRYAPSLDEAIDAQWRGRGAWHAGPCTPSGKVERSRTAQAARLRAIDRAMARIDAGEMGYQRRLP